MVLTFSKTSGGERRRECDEWVRALRQNITSTVYHPVSTASAPKEAQPAPAPAAAAPAPVPQPPAPVPQSPAPAPQKIEITNAPPPKKRIEIARPMKKIVEAPPAMPVPVETTSLPQGSSFCNRCGNRVPPESAFCNRCGTPVMQDTGFFASPDEEMPPSPQPEPVVPQVQVPVFPMPGTTEKKDRPIEQVIHSIEPLIEDSVPRSAPAPLVPAKQMHQAPPEVPAEPAEPAFPPVAPAAETAAPAEAAPMGDIQWPVLSKTGGSGGPETPAPPAGADTPPPVQQALASPPPAPRKVSMTMVAVLGIVLVAVIGGVFLFMQGPGGIPGITPTPEITTPATPVPTAVVTTVATARPTTATPPPTPTQVSAPSVMVPKTGVWVKIGYAGKFEGTVGSPGRLKEIDATGDQYYQVPTTDGPVDVSVRKADGTSGKMTVDVYKDGGLVRHAETVAPRGLIEFQASLKAEAAATTAAPA
jgi:hypothetical protein